jgi:hypothetical protein
MSRVAIRSPSLEMTLFGISPLMGRRTILESERSEETDRKSKVSRHRPSHLISLSAIGMSPNWPALLMQFTSVTMPHSVELLALGGGSTVIQNLERRWMTRNSVPGRSEMSTLRGALVHQCYLPPTEKDTKQHRATSLRLCQSAIEVRSFCGRWRS